MDDISSGGGRVLVSCLWLKTTLFMIAGWVVMIFAGDHWRIGMMLAATGCVSSALAATYHIRSYGVRICYLMRAIAEVRATDHPMSTEGLRSVRR